MIPHLIHPDRDRSMTGSVLPRKGAPISQQSTLLPTRHPRAPRTTRHLSLAVSVRPVSSPTYVRFPPVSVSIAREDLRRAFASGYRIAFAPLTNGGTLALAPRSKSRLGLKESDTCPYAPPGTTNRVPRRIPVFAAFPLTQKHLRHFFNRTHLPGPDCVSHQPRPGSVAFPETAPGPEPPSQAVGDQEVTNRSKSGSRERTPDGP